MQQQFKAYACEEMDGLKFLLPGCPVVPGKRQSFKSGEKIEVELADGTLLQTTIVNTKICNFAESAMKRFLGKGDSDFYYAIQVPDDFFAPGIELGATVYLIDSPTSQNP